MYGYVSTWKGTVWNGDHLTALGFGKASDGKADLNLGNDSCQNLESGIIYSVRSCSVKGLYTRLLSEIHARDIQEKLPLGNPN